ncbi:hypothetical protein M0R72_03440 [Candidatus Pacearchaeota archaeon]|jgi:uncharacterized membrane protein YphA (DoxX/SURF4 family)|nr:hypothetical protein [Candidatus Pacearchaeota archaeon]
MVMNTILIFAIAVAALIWLLSVIKGHKHRLVAIFLIGFLFFSIYGFNITFSGKNISLDNFEDFGNAAKLYLSWYGNVFNNMQILTANAVKLDWKGNDTT